MDIFVLVIIAFFAGIIFGLIISLSEGKRVLRYDMKCISEDLKRDLDYYENVCDGHFNRKAVDEIIDNYFSPNNIPL